MYCALLPRSYLLYCYCSELQVLTVLLYCAALDGICTGSRTIPVGVISSVCPVADYGSS